MFVTKRKGWNKVKAEIKISKTETKDPKIISGIVVTKTNSQKASRRNPLTAQGNVTFVTLILKQSHSGQIKQHAARS